jgi:hypothetical protein
MYGAYMGVGNANIQAALEDITDTGTRDTLFIKPIAIDRAGS